MMRNPGTCPPEARGKRINVILSNGMKGSNWAADGKPPTTRWSRTGSPFDIDQWEICA